MTKLQEQRSARTHTLDLWHVVTDTARVSIMVCLVVDVLLLSSGMKSKVLEATVAKTRPVSLSDC